MWQVYPHIVSTKPELMQPSYEPYLFVGVNALTPKSGHREVLHEAPHSQVTGDVDYYKLKAKS